MDMYGYSGIFLMKRMFDSRIFGAANMTDAAKPHGCDNGALMDRFGVLIQGLLAVVAFSTLMLKRFREPAAVRRPWRIWFYDTSKQAIGALFIHFANVFLSTLTKEDPCSLYLMNFLLDATLGMLVIWAGVKVVSWVVEYKQFTLLTFGEYGDPPQAAAWIGQCAVYLLIMVLEKSVISLVLLIPGWTSLQEVLLDYIPDPQVELVLVMLIVPFFVNAIMFWVVDSLMMRKYKSLKTLETAHEDGKQAEASPWVTSEESQVLLMSDPDTDPDPSEGEQDGVNLRSSHTPVGEHRYLVGWWCRPCPLTPPFLNPTPASEASTLQLDQPVTPASSAPQRQTDWTSTDGLERSKVKRYPLN